MLHLIFFVTDADHQRLVDQLQAAMESRKIETLDPAVKEYRKGIIRKRDQDELLAQAERLLEMLKCSLGLCVFEQSSCIYPALLIIVLTFL